MWRPPCLELSRRVRKAYGDIKLGFIETRRLQLRTFLRESQFGSLGRLSVTKGYHTEIFSLREVQDCTNRKHCGLNHVW